MILSDSPITWKMPVRAETVSPSPSPMSGSSLLSTVQCFVIYWMNEWLNLIHKVKWSPTFLLLLMWLVRKWVTEIAVKYLGTCTNFTSLFSPSNELYQVYSTLIIWRIITVRILYCWVSTYFLITSILNH